MKKNYKTYAKKSMSLFLAVIMLLSCWVWVAPQKAEAAEVYSGGYPVSITMSNGDKKISEGHVLVKYYKFKADGTGIDYNSTGTYKFINSLGSVLGQNVSNKTYTTADAAGRGTGSDSGLVPGWPYEIEVKANNTSIFNKTSTTTVKIVVGNKQINTETFTTVDATDWFRETDNWHSTDESWPKPALQNPTTPSAATITVPNNGTAASKSWDIHFVDQYGLDWSSLGTPTYSYGVSSALKRSGSTYTISANHNIFNGLSGYSASSGKYTSNLSVAFAGKTVTFSVTLQSSKYNLLLKHCPVCGEGHKEDCYYNGTITVPAACTKPTDANGHYTFKGWIASETNAPVIYKTGETEQKPKYKAGDNITNVIKDDTETYVPVYECTPHYFDGDWVYNENTAQGSAFGNHSKKCKFDGCTYYGIDNLFNNQLGGYKECYGTWSGGDSSSHSLICADCGKVYTHPPQWEKVRTLSAANCIQGEQELQKCSVCGQERTATVSQPDTSKHIAQDEYTVLTPATCIEEGRQVKYCVHHSNVIVVDDKIPATGIHTPEGPYEKVNDEYHAQRCSMCKELVRPYRGHTWDDGVVTTDPECGKPGVKTITCTTCNASYTEEVDALEHNYVAYSDDTHVETDSTCVLHGVRYEKCSNCNDIISIEKDLDAENHNYVFTNLEEKGHGYVCINEDANGNKCGHEINVVAHNWDDGVVTKAATCKETGTKLFTCKDNCGATYIEILPIDKINGHNMSAATPDTDELTHSAVCSICNEKVTQDCVRGEHCVCICGRQIEHSMVVDLDDKKSDATCNALAVYGTKCEYCGDKGEGTLTYGDYADHVWDETNKDSLVTGNTCETGSVYYKYCTVCKEHANEVTHHIPDVLTWEDNDALGHNYKAEYGYVSHGNGTHSYKCERFDACDSYGVGTEKGATVKCAPQGDYINKTEVTHSQKCLCGYEIVSDHNLISNPAKEDIASTCVTTGMKYEICSDCAYEKETVIAINDKAHKWDESSYVCITDGKDGAHARKCLNVDADGNQCPDTGTPDKGEGGTYAHAWSEGVVTKAPTCTAEGTKKYTCKASGCGATYEEVLAKDFTNHVDENGKPCETTISGYIAPTCNTEGYSGDAYCNACGKIAAAGKELAIDPNAHRPEALEDFTGTKATCTEPGYADYAYCSDCNKAVSSKDGITIIPALGHNFEGVTPDKVEGTDKHAYKCTRCDEIKYEACSGGEANCKDKAVCEKCNEAYGETTDHTTEKAEWVAGGKDAETGKFIHVKKCDVCDEIAETEECRGGNPTCTDAAVCTTCGQEHKEARGHDFTGKAKPTENGKHKYKCTRCDAYGNEAECSATATETRVAPTCYENAYYEYVCDDCGYSWTVKYTEDDEIPAEDLALGHDYTDKMPDAAHLYKAATCKEEGPAQNIYWYDCSRCDRSAATLIEEGMTEEEIAQIVAAKTYAYGEAAEHNFNGRTMYEGAELATPADCEHDATYYVYCTVCKKSSKGVEGKEATFIDYNSATEHNWVEAAEAKYLKSEATCVAKAVYYKSCSVCKTKSTVTFEYGDVLAHEFSQQILDYAHRITRANCQTAASYWYDCANCNVNAKNIDKTGMSEADIAALKFVDTESGLDSSKHISIENIPVKNPTCTEAGHSAYKICTACNTTIGEVVVYEKLSHDFSGAYKYYIAAEEGQDDQHNRKCRNCDAYGYVVDGVQTVDAKVNCSFGEWKQVSGTETHEKYCECGNKKTGECASETSSPSCTEKATCDTCGGKFGETSEHNKADVWTYSDETVGYHVKVCTVCNEVLETQNCYGGVATCGQQAECEFCHRGYGKTPDHTYGEWIDDAENPATCTTAKWQYRYCTVCKAESTKQTQQTGKPLGHDISDWYYATEEDKPTCKDEGLMTKTCSRCDLKETKVVPVDLDVHDEYIANQIGRWEKEEGSADCVNGIVWYLYCNVCDKKLDSKIESGDHQWKEIAVVSATCTADGYITYKCDLCNFTKTEYPDDLKSEGHAWDKEVIDKAATCGAAGRAYKICSKCNAKGEKYAIPATGHGPDVTPEYTIIVAPVAATCTSAGHNGYWKCKRCSYDEHLDENSDYKVFPKLPHKDTDGDGLCDECHGKIYADDSGSNKSCGCMCHNDSFLMQFFYKIAKFFWKLFGTNKSCKCGTVHY